MIKHFTRAATRALIGLGMTAAVVTSATAQAPSAAAQTQAQADEIVVTAQRIGIPVWRVAGPQGTVVLVGAIGDVPAGTTWDPLPLDAALAKADRVMFPESRAASNIGLFSAVGTFAKFVRQGSLPKGQTLQALTTPAQWARLIALRDRGVLKPGFERRHPVHLAMALGRGGRTKRKMSPGAEAYVRRFVKKNKAKRVPMERIDFKAIAAQYFAVGPRAHVACMMDAVTEAEKGAAGVRARSDAVGARASAWAARRVPEALTAKVERGQESCWPNGTPIMAAWEASLSSSVRAALGRPQVTLAVMSLDALGEPGGVLDDLVAAGFDVSGPRWKR